MICFAIRYNIYPIDTSPNCVITVKINIGNISSPVTVTPTNDSQNDVNKTNINGPIIFPGFLYCLIKNKPKNVNNGENRSIAPIFDVVAITKCPNVIPNIAAIPKNAINGAKMKPGIIVNKILISSDTITAPDESIALSMFAGNKLKIEVSGRPKLPAAVIPAVITNKPKRGIFTIPFSGLASFDKLCYRRLEIR